MELNRAYNTDCLTGMRDIPPGSVDMILCDLPYGVTARCGWDSPIDPSALWELWGRAAKPGCAILLFGQGLFSARMIMSNEKMYRYTIIWEKTTPTGFLNAGRMPLRTHEDIMVFYDRLPTYNPQKTSGHKRKASSASHKRGSLASPCYGGYGLTGYDSTERLPGSVWRFATDRQKLALHSTQKPLELCRYAIRTYSDPGDTVLDCCCGSGTTLLAAALEGRNFIGMDNGTCENRKSRYDGWAWADVSMERVREGLRGAGTA